MAIRAILRHCRTVIMLLTPAAVLGCAAYAGFGGGDDGAASPRDAHTVILHVINGHAADVRVFLLQGTTRVRLGTVGSFEQRTFSIRAAQLGRGGWATLAVQPLGERQTIVLEPIDARLGDAMELRVMNRLTLSTLSRLPLP